MKYVKSYRKNYIVNILKNISDVKTFVNLNTSNGLKRF